MRLILNGFDGRLGTEITAVARELDYEVVPLTREASHSSEALSHLLQHPAVLCDVTVAEGTALLVHALSETQGTSLGNCRALVVGTTGHTPAQLADLRALSKRLGILIVPNFSRGVLLFEQLLQAKTALGPSVADLARILGFDLALWESHHTRKVDAPSGTAKSLAARAGISPDRIAATRVGSVVGEHTLFMSGDSEEVRISHTAHTRRLFAAGAVDLCLKLWEAKPAPGLWNRDEFYKIVEATTDSSRSPG